MAEQSDLVVHDLCKRFGDQAILEHLDVTVPAGSVTAVLGASGSGKTTLLRIIAGLERPDHGTVVLGPTVLNDQRTHLRPEERRIGYVAQEGNLFPHLTIAQNVGFGLPRRERRNPKVTALLETVGLAGLEERYPHQLSGGQQQRVALARSLAVGSRAILLDEPFNTLDATLRASIRVDVHRIVREAGATAVLVTHDQDEALLLADFVAVLRDGVIAQFATPTELYDHPVDAEVAAFVGEANLVSGTRAGDIVHTQLGSLPLRNGHASQFSGDALVMVRPEEVTISRDLEGPGLRGRVHDVEFYGPLTILRVIVEGRPNDAMVVRRMAKTDLDVGSDVRLTVDGTVCAWPSADSSTRGEGLGRNDASLASARSRPQERP
jgi:iron(III) transport system ATP-binding protein